MEEKQIKKAKKTIAQLKKLASEENITLRDAIDVATLNQKETEAETRMEAMEMAITMARQFAAGAGFPLPNEPVTPMGQA